MFRADFARLCDVSPSMISKYARRGLIVLRQDRWVRVADTLAALEGHLDEEKRTAALKALAKAEAALPPLLAVAGGGAPPAASQDDSDAPGAAPAEPQGWKGRRDKFAALTAEVDYHERVGALVDAGEIAAGVEAVIADFCSVTEQSLKLDVAEIAAELDLSLDQARTLKTKLQARSRALRANFARVCRKAAEDVGAP